MVGIRSLLFSQFRFPDIHSLFLFAPPNSVMFTAMNAPADVLDGIEKGQLRLGILLGEYVAYVEASEVGTGFEYSICCAGVRVGGGAAPDLNTARERAEDILRMLSKQSIQ